ncbi:MAG: hypothetical protein ACREBC_07360 [Pyrinomonadaceae bacterium]
MSIPERTASDLIRGLAPFDFQHFCTIFLRDLGYQVVFGPPGPDGSQDITGSGPRGPFVAHCTTGQGSQRRLVAKLTNDVSGGAVTDLTTRTVRKEIILFWTSRRLDPFRDRQNIESELHVQLATLESEYHAHPPFIMCYSPDTMAQEIVNHGDGSAYQMLLNRLGVRRLRQLSADDSIVPEADLLMPSGGTKKRFIKWLDDPSLRSAPSLRATDILRAVLNSAWDTLVFHPVLAVEVLKSDRARNLPDILPFLCSLALDEPVSTSSLGSLVNSIETAERGPAMNPADLARDLQLFRARLLRFLCDRQPLLFTNPDARGLMMSLLNSNDDFQGSVAVDLALRAHCNYIRLDPDTDAAILTAASTHIDVRPHSVLAQLWPIVTNPLSTAKARPWLDVLQSLRAIATTVQTVIDARWCMTALLRVMPLFDAEENDDYGDDVIQMLLSDMPGRGGWLYSSARTATAFADQKVFADLRHALAY